MSLKSRLLRYFQNRKGEFIAKGRIEEIVIKETGYTVENANRRLRQLESEGRLEVKLVKNHAHYRYKEPEDWATYAKEQIAIFDSY